MEQQQTKLRDEFGRFVAVGKVNPPRNKFSKITPETENQVKKMREEGITIRKISKKLSLSSSKISRILYKCIFSFLIFIFFLSFISAFLPSNANKITDWGRSTNWFATNTTPTISDNSQYFNPSQTQDTIQESNLTAKEKEAQRLYNNYLIEQRNNSSKPVMNFTQFKRSIAPSEPPDLLALGYFVTPIILFILIWVSWNLFRSRSSDV